MLAAATQITKMKGPSFPTVPGGVAAGAREPPRELDHVDREFDCTEGNEPARQRARAPDHDDGREHG
jgi:hypothetical protein